MLLRFACILMIWSIAVRAEAISWKEAQDQDAEWFQSAEGKRVVITGAAQGIGLAIAETFLAEGASLFLIDRDGDLLANEAVRLSATNGKVGYTAADIADAERPLTAIAVISGPSSRVKPTATRLTTNCKAPNRRSSDALCSARIKPVHNDMVPAIGSALAPMASI